MTSGCARWRARLAKGADLAVLTNARLTRLLIRYAEDLAVQITVDLHLISNVEDTHNWPWPEAANVVFCSGERFQCSAEKWVARVFARYPGCEVVGIGRGAGGAILGLRDGTLVRAMAVVTHMVRSDRCR